MITVTWDTSFDAGEVVEINLATNKARIRRPPKQAIFDMGIDCQSKYGHQMLRMVNAVNIYLQNNELLMPTGEQIRVLEMLPEIDVGTVGKIHCRRLRVKFLAQDNFVDYAEVPISQEILFRYKIGRDISHSSTTVGGSFTVVENT